MMSHLFGSLPNKHVFLHLENIFAGQSISTALQYFIVLVLLVYSTFDLYQKIAFGYCSPRIV